MIEDLTLHDRIQDLAREHRVLRAPGNQKWIGCEHCDAVIAVPFRTDSAVCEDCARPCSHVDCTLMIYEHAVYGGCIIEEAAG